MSTRGGLATLGLAAVMLLTGCSSSDTFAYHFKAQKAYRYHITSDESFTYDFGTGDVRTLVTHFDKDYQLTVEKLQDGLVSVRVDVTHIKQTSQGGGKSVKQTLPDISLRFWLREKTGAVDRVELLDSKTPQREGIETLASRYSPANYLPVLPGSSVIKVGDKWTWDGPGANLGDAFPAGVQQHNAAVFTSSQGQGDKAVAVFQVDTTQGSGATASAWHLTASLDESVGLPVQAENDATLHYSQNVTLGTKVAVAQVTDLLKEKVERISVN